MEYQHISIFQNRDNVWLTFLVLLFCIGIVLRKCSLIAPINKGWSIDYCRQYGISQGDTLYGVDIYILKIKLSKIS
jgi:hypothetical protein